MNSALYEGTIGTGEWSRSHTASRTGSSTHTSTWRSCPRPSMRSRAGRPADRRSRGSREGIVWATPRSRSTRRSGRSSRRGCASAGSNPFAYSAADLRGRVQPYHYLLCHRRDGSLGQSFAQVDNTPWGEHQTTRSMSKRTTSPKGKGCAFGCPRHFTSHLLTP